MIMSIMSGEFRYVHTSVLSIQLTLRPKIWLLELEINLLRPKISPFRPLRPFGAAALLSFYNFKTAIEQRNNGHR